MTDNGKVVADFLKAWSRRDPDELAAFFTEDAVWEDGVPSESYRGKKAIREKLARYAPIIVATEIEIVSQVVQGSLVMHERIDRVTLKDRRVEARVVGVFEVEGGKIKANRDYWNPSAYFPPAPARPGAAAPPGPLAP